MTVVVMEGVAAKRLSPVVLGVDAIDLGEMQCRSGIVASGDVGQSRVKVVQHSDKVRQDLRASRRGECGWSGEPRLSRGTEGRGSGPWRQPSQAQPNYGGNERRSAPRSAFLRATKWTSPQVKSFNLLRSKKRGELEPLIGLLKEAADISRDNVQRAGLPGLINRNDYGASALA
jgi:hypothetical protein